MLLYARAWGHSPGIHGISWVPSRNTSFGKEHLGNTLVTLRCPQPKPRGLKFFHRKHSKPEEQSHLSNAWGNLKG